MKIKFFRHLGLVLLMISTACRLETIAVPIPSPVVISPSPPVKQTSSPSLSATPSPSLTSSSTPTPLPTLAPTPTETASPTPVFVPIRAMRLDFKNVATSRPLVEGLEKQMKAAGINMVGLGAGRVEWAYFKWGGHETNWSSDVRDTGIDFLAQDAARFSQWAQVNAVIDVLSPNYIKSHPETAAVSFGGIRSQDLVSTAELTHGEYGRLLLAMIEFIAANYPVDSISITELFYHRDGYGPDDKALYLAYSGRNDWPRHPDGTIDHNDSSIGNWRTHELDVYLDQAVAIAHRYGKQLFMDVGLSTDFGASLEALERVTNEHGTNYNVVLEHMDKIVIWGYFALDEGFPPDFFEVIAQFLSRFRKDRVIISIGLWSRNTPAVLASQLKEAILASQAGGMPNFWITPITLMTDGDWQVLDELWGNPPTP